MKLSDAFMQLDGELKNQLENANYPLEIFVKVININVDKENPILKRCEALKEYAEFIEQVRSNIENDVPEPFTNAIKEAIKKGFLSNYLNRKMFSTEPYFFPICFKLCLPPETFRMAMFFPFSTVKTRL